MEKHRGKVKRSELGKSIAGNNLSVPHCGSACPACLAFAWVRDSGDAHFPLLIVSLQEPGFSTHTTYMCSTTLISSVADIHKLSVRWPQQLGPGQHSAPVFLHVLFFQLYMTHKPTLIKKIPRTVCLAHSFSLSLLSPVGSQHSL